MFPGGTDVKALAVFVGFSSPKVRTPDCRAEHQARYAPSFTAVETGNEPPPNVNFLCRHSLRTAAIPPPLPSDYRRYAPRFRHHNEHRCPPYRQRNQTPIRFNLTFGAGEADIDDDVLFLAAACGEAKPTSTVVAFWVDAGLLERVRRATGGDGVRVTGDGASSAAGSNGIRGGTIRDGTIRDGGGGIKKSTEPGQR